MAEPSTYQSLYRRYRSQRFDQVLGQDHITTALRNAVRDGRVGHAYLFSGPRGTGKTSTARILAKVLNCEAPEDGEPCGKCDNCLSVERGLDIDWLLEQDAASKSKVDDMRDLLDRVPLGTSGNRKVIILDEVHMLSQGAENALLKTLEEPPAHVVFVLATTDPQKVRPTIRSRAQHFEFHLLNAEVIAEHVRYVIRDAGLGFAEDRLADVVDHVVQVGGGSARDTLSALDQVAALGDVVVDTQPVRAILDAVAARDTGGVLVAVADAVSTGREPRTLGEALIASLRDAFLEVMGAADDRLPPAERDRARQLGEAMGPARLTRALEVLGEALTELARKPDPRIVVEVALVRVAQPDTDTSVDALAARVRQLEQQLSSGQVSAVTAPQPPVPGAQPSGGAPAAQPSGDAPAAQPSGDAPAAQPSGGAPAAQGGSTGTRPADAARAALAQERKPQGGAPNQMAQEGGEASPTGQEGETPASRGGRPTLGALARDAGAAPPEGSPPQTPTQPQPQPQPQPTSPPQTPSTQAPTPAAQPAPSPEPPASPAPERMSETAPPGAQEPVPEPAPAAPVSTQQLPSLDQLLAAWEGSLLGALPLSVRSKWRGGRWAGVADGQARFSVPNAWHKKACDEGRRDVEQALAGQFAVPVPVEVVVDGGGSGPAVPPAGGSAHLAGADQSGPSSGPSASDPSTGAPGSGEPPPEWPPASGGPAAQADPDDLAELDVSEVGQLADADDIVTGGVELLMKSFGGELITAEGSL